MKRRATGHDQLKHSLFQFIFISMADIPEDVVDGGRRCGPAHQMN